MSTKDLIVKKRQLKKEIKYELLPPDGGWGYIVATSVSVAFNVTLIPMAAFGLIYGNFLANIGNETTGTTLSNGIFNTVFNFTGLIANNLLAKYTYRYVSIIGSIIFFFGSISIVFVNNLIEFIITFSIIQGIGMGLVMPATYSALNSYFDKKLNIVNSVAQALMVIASILMPAFAKYLMDTFGFRGTIAILAAISLNCIVASVTLQPVEWHMKKKIVNITKISKSKESLIDEGLKVQIEPLIDEKYIMPRPRSSIISMGDRALSVTTINKLGNLKDESKLGFGQSLLKFLNLEMFKDPIYINISLGMALSFTSDVAFISIIPLVLMNDGFDSSQATFFLTVFFVTDLIARILLSVVHAFCKLDNRLLFFLGSLFSLLFRIVFVMRNTFYWKLCSIGILGFLRCFIQTPLPLVLADAYSDNFATAISLYMVICGIVSLLFGPLMSFTKSVTQSDAMVIHVLSSAYLICCLTWTLEFVYKKCRKNNK